MILVTGTSSGIGRAIALRFLDEGYDVTGIDIQESTISHPCYRHEVCDVRDYDALPDIDDVQVIINNAGTVDDSDALAVNIDGYVNIIDRYGDQPTLRSLLNIGSISARLGLDTPRYAASQGGRVSLTKHMAIKMAPRGVTVNCLSPGAVMTGLEPELYEHKILVDAVAEESLLKKWATVDEMADWAFFLTITNKSMTGQDVLVDNGEEANHHFVSVADL